MINNHDKSTTITINENVSTSNLINNNTNNDESTNKESNQFLNGLNIIERNVIYIFDQFNYMIRTSFSSSGTSIFAPAIYFILIFIYFLNLLSSPRASTVNDLDKLSNSHRTESFVSSTLTLLPGNILAPNYWLLSCISFITFPFFEYHWYSVLNDIIIVYICSHLIEPIIGRKELVTFFFITNSFVAFFTIIHYIMLYSFYGDAKYLYSDDVRLYGLSGYIAAVCVTIKQQLPQSILLSTGLGKFKNNNLPLFVLILYWFLYLVNFLNGCIVLMFFYGLLVSWFYLRFVQYHPCNNLRGDLSPAFDFSTFFPKVLKPYVSVVCNSIYSVFVRFHLLSANNYRQYQNLIKLSERYVKEQGDEILSKHFKHNSNGEYNYQRLNENSNENMNENLNEAKVQNM